MWILFACLLVARQTIRTGAQVVPTKSSTVFSNVNFQKPLLHILNTCEPSSTVVFIYDETVEMKGLETDLIRALHTSGKLVMAINVAKRKAESLHDEFDSTHSEVLDSIMKWRHTYGKSGIMKNFIFVVWASAHLELLTPQANHKWTFFDRVIVPIEDLGPEYRSKLIHMEFWKSIPFVVGIQRNPKQLTSLDIFTVKSYCGQNSDVCPLSLNTWLIDTEEFSRPNRDFFPDRFSTFNGAELKIGSTWKEPFLIWGNKQQPYKDGLDFRLVKLIERKMNFTATFRMLDKIGKFDNGGWTGTLGLIANGTLGFAVGGITVRPEMLKSFEFTRSHYVDSFTFVSPLIRTDDLWGTLAKPFQMIVWYSLAITGGVMSVLIFVVANLLKILSKLEGSKLQWYDEWFAQVGRGIAIVLTQMAQKPCPRVPTSNPLRMLFVGTSWGFNIMGILFVTYLISTMSHHNSLRSVDRVDDIVKSGIPLDIRDYDAELNPRLKAEKPELWKYAKMVDWFESAQSLKAVTAGQRIYIDSRARLSYMQRYELNKTRIHSFHMSSQNVLDGLDLSWPMRKNWPFRRAVNKVVVRAIESGIVEYWMSKFRAGKFAWDSEAELIEESRQIFLFDWDSVRKIAPNTRNLEGHPKTKRDRMYNWEPIKNDDIQSLIQLYLFGVAISVLCLALELLVNGMWNLLRMLFWLLMVVVRLLCRISKSNPIEDPLPVTMFTSVAGLPHSSNYYESAPLSTGRRLALR